MADPVLKETVPFKLLHLEKGNHITIDAMKCFFFKYLDSFLLAFLLNQVSLYSSISLGN